MNPEQKQAIDMALKGHNMLLLGAAGTGKSYVINEIYKQLSEKGINVKITCSTGIACQVYGSTKACTVHQFLGTHCLSRPSLLPANLLMDIIT